MIMDLDIQYFMMVIKDLSNQSSICEYGSIFIRYPAI